MSVAMAAAVDGGAMWVLLRVSRAFGTAPVQLSPARGRVCTVSSIWYTLYSLALLVYVVTVEVAIICFSSSTALVNVYASAFLFWLFKAFSAAVSLYLTATAVIGAPKRVRLLMDFLNRIHKINSQVGYTYTFYTEVRTMWTLLLLSMPLTIAAFAATISVRVAYSGRGDNPAYILEMLTYIIEISTKLGILIVVRLQLIFVLILVNETFKNFNNHLKMIRGKMLSKCTTTMEDEMSQMIRQLSLGFRMSVNLLRDINEHTGIIFLLTYIFYVFHITVTIWHLMLAVTNEDVSTRAIRVASECFWIAYYSISITSFIEPCHRVSKTIKHTGSLVNELLDLAPSRGALITCITDFQDQFLMPMAEFSMFGIFWIKRGLIFNTYSYVSTILSLATQFGILSLDN